MPDLVAGTIVWVRVDIRRVAPAIVTNDYADDNAGGVVAVLVLDAQSISSLPFRAVPQCQPETAETPAADLIALPFGYYMPMGSDLALRDLQAEVDNPPAPPETKKELAPSKFVAPAAKK